MMEDQRILECDQRSMGWCYRMGLEGRFRAMAEGIPATRWQPFCPFRERTPHRKHWLAGWREGSKR